MVRRAGEEAGDVGADMRIRLVDMLKERAGPSAAPAAGCGVLPGPLLEVDRSEAGALRGNGGAEVLPFGDFVSVVVLLGEVVVDAAKVSPPLPGGLAGTLGETLSSARVYV